jgi:hypothetical protein
MGVPVPTIWAAATESAQAEMVEFARESLRMATEAHEWQALTRLYSAPLGTGPEQTVNLPSDFGRLVPGTVWLSDRARAVDGPVSEVEYESLRQPPASASGPVFRISEGAIQLLASPAPSGSLTLRYVSSHLVSTGATTIETYQGDNDVALIDERLVALGLIFLWRDSKGLNAQNAAVMYRNAMAVARAQDRPLGVMSFGGHVSADTLRANDDGSVDVGV